MCVRGHDGSQVETRPDGARICTGCRDEFTAKKNAARRVNTRQRAQKGATREETMMEAPSPGRSNYSGLSTTTPGSVQPY